MGKGGWGELSEHVQSRYFVRTSYWESVKKA